MSTAATTDPAPRPRPGIGVEIALALGLVTLATIVLNAGVFWLLLKKTEETRRTDLALALSAALAAQLEVEAQRPAPEDGYRRVLSAYAGAGLELEELWVSDASGSPIAGAAVPRADGLDPGLRAAFFGREQHAEVRGLLWEVRSVRVTTPIAPHGRPVAALRVQIPLRLELVPGGPAGFVLAYSGSSGMAVSLFGFSLLRRRLLRPIAVLRAGTERIAEGDFGHRVRVDAAQELQDLCVALNQMSASLASFRERTEDQLSRLAAANAGLREAQGALVRSERLAGVGRLAAGLAHEVGNPLAAVSGYMELLQSGLGDPALERDLVARSRQELGRIHRVIRQLLDYSRTGPGHPEALSVVAAVEEAFSTVRHQPAFRDLLLRADVGAVPPVWLEADLFQQLLVNLLLNAADAQSGGQEKEIRVEAALDDGQVVLRVLDRGHGFDEVSLDRALEPFYTTREVGAGTGLGLATVSQIVARAGGSIWLRNRPSGGAEVGLRLPVAPPVPPA